MAPALLILGDSRGKGERRLILLTRLLLVQVGTHRQGVIGVDRGVAFFEMLNHTVLVDDDVGALRPLVGVALHVVTFQDAVSGQHLFVHVAQQGELDVDLLGESGVGRWRIHADAENLRIRGIDFATVDSRLDRLELLGSTPGEGQHIDRQQDIFLAAVVA